MDAELGGRVPEAVNVQSEIVVEGRETEQREETFL